MTKPESTRFTASSIAHKYNQYSNKYIPVSHIDYIRSSTLFSPPIEQINNMKEYNHHKFNNNNSSWSEIPAARMTGTERSTAKTVKHALNLLIDVESNVTTIYHSTNDTPYRAVKYYTTPKR